MQLFKNKPTRILIITMAILVGIALLIAKIYYSDKNKSIDPRISKARDLYKNYNLLAAANKFEDVLNLMDSIEYIYQNIPHYRQSYETGVLYNNRTATYLTLVLLKDSLNRPLGIYDNLSRDSLVNLAEHFAKNSIEIYEKWLLNFDSLDYNAILQKISDTFLTGLEGHPLKMQQKYLDVRVNEILAAQKENKRRLSVSFTNLGVIQRIRGNYQEAVLNYTKAIEYWDRNLTAENNLNKLIGRPLKKRNMIQKLFPPGKK